MNLFQYLFGYLLVLFLILNGVSAIFRGKYLGENSTYKTVKLKYPNTTQRQWAIFDGSIYILFGIMFLINGLFALILLIPMYYIGREISGKYIFN